MLEINVYYFIVGCINLFYVILILFKTHSPSVLIYVLLFKSIILQTFFFLMILLHQCLCELFHPRRSVSVGIGSNLFCFFIKWVSAAKGRAILNYFKYTKRDKVIWNKKIEQNLAPPSRILQGRRMDRALWAENR